MWLSIADMPIGLNAKAIDSREYVSDFAAKTMKTVPEGTLLVSFKLTLGRLCVAGRDLFTNEAIAALHDLDRTHISREFLYWFLTFFDWDEAAAGDHKIKGKTLNKAKLKELEVILPPLEEQKRIVAALDKAFAALDRARALAEANLADADELLTEAREQLLDPAQVGWDSKKLANQITIKHGFAFKSAFFTSDGDFVLLTPGNFFESGGFRHRGKKQKYYVGQIPNGFVLSEGDLLMAMTEQAPGLLGSCILVPESDRFLHNQRLGLIEPREEVSWHSPFFAHVFNTKSFRKALSDSCTGIKVRHTSPDKIGLVPVPFPSTLQEQVTVAAKIGKLVESWSSLRVVYQLKLAELADLRQSLLHKAFAGELT